MSAMWEAHDDLRFRGSLGMGYRAPSAKELYYVFNHASAGYIVYGNPNLNPETSENYNLSVEYTYRDRSTARVNFFYNNLHDLILYQLIGTTPEYLTGVYRYGNIWSAWTGGVEIERGFKIGDHFQLKLSYSYMESRNRQTGEQLVGQPKHSARWNADYTYGATAVKVWGEYTGSSPYTSIWETDELSSAEMTYPYQLWNASVSRTFDKRFTAYLKGENLFDYTQIRYGPRSGRIITLGVRWTYDMDK